MFLIWPKGFKIDFWNREWIIQKGNRIIALTTMPKIRPWFWYDMCEMITKYRQHLQYLVQKKIIAFPHFCQAQFQFSPIPVQLELSTALILIISTHPHPPPG